MRLEPAATAPAVSPTASRAAASGMAAVPTPSPGAAPAPASRAASAVTAATPRAVAAPATTPLPPWSLLSSPAAPITLIMRGSLTVGAELGNGATGIVHRAAWHCASKVKRPATTAGGAAADSASSSTDATNASSADSRARAPPPQSLPASLRALVPPHLQAAAGPHCARAHTRRNPPATTMDARNHVTWARGTREGRRRSLALARCRCRRGPAAVPAGPPHRSAPQANQCRQTRPVRSMRWMASWEGPP